MRIRIELRWLVLGLAAGLLAGWWLARPRTPAGEPPAARPGAREAPAPAHTATVERRSLPEHELLPASLRSRRTSQLTSEVQARVLEVTRRAGEPVAEGELLVELDASALLAAREAARHAAEAARVRIASAEEGVLRVQAALTEARAHRERTESLLASGSATAEAAEQSRAREAGARAALAQAEGEVAVARAQAAGASAGLEQAEIGLRHARIGAPFAGVVSERMVEPGELALPGRALLTLVDPAQLRVVALAREELAGELRPGAKLEVDVPAAGLTLTAEVEELLPRVDERSRSLELRLRLDASAGCLPGMFARVRLPRAPREVVLVPAAALLRVGQLASVRVREAEGWRRRHVRVGAVREDGRLEVLAGLAAGELVGWDDEAGR